MRGLAANPCLPSVDARRASRATGVGGTVMDVATWLLLALGAVPGFFLGRWTAETRRARFDMGNVWTNRNRYRQ